MTLDVFSYPGLKNSNVPQGYISGPFLLLIYINFVYSLCEWFIDNKLLIHFGDDKTLTIFFSRKKRPPKLSIS